MTLTRQQRKIVQERAGDCCEYCHFPSSGGTVTFHIDHIISLKHEGTDDLKNLCLACYKCNTHKGSNVGGFDPENDELTRLYHPREQVWDEHFEIQSDMLIEGLTPEGRTTVKVLHINDENRVENRQLLAELGDYPCKKAE
ncbi:MAG: HNH endonuclease signature motif containing protein [Aggregatilineales bacterium]